MRKILATLIAIASLGYSSAFAGTLVINTDLTDPAPVISKQLEIF